MILDDDSDDEDDDLDEKKITVPLTVTMVVIAGYIFGGAVLFGLWEGIFSAFLMNIFFALKGSKPFFLFL